MTLDDEAIARLRNAANPRTTVQTMTRAEFVAMLSEKTGVPLKYIASGKSVPTEYPEGG